MYRSLMVLALHIFLVLAVAGKYRYDRVTLPRQWIKVRSVDPDSLLRGRYLALQTNESPPRRFEYFIPEHSPLANRLSSAEQLWAEVSLATNGLRPIRLEVRAIK